MSIGADALIYQDIEAMMRSVTDVNPALTRFEASCFDGVYVTGDVTPEYLDRIESAHARPRSAEEEPARNQMNLQFSVVSD